MAAVDVAREHALWSRVGRRESGKKEDRRERRGGDPSPHPVLLSATSLSVSSFSAFPAGACSQIKRLAIYQLEVNRRSEFVKLAIRMLTLLQSKVLCSD